MHKHCHLLPLLLLALVPATAHAGDPISPEDAVKQIRSQIKTELQTFKGESKSATSIFRSEQKSLLTDLKRDPNSASTLSETAAFSYTVYVTTLLNAGNRAYGSVASSLASLLPDITGPIPKELLAGGCGAVDELCAQLESDIAKAITKAVKSVKKLHAAAEKTDNVRASFSHNPRPRLFPITTDIDGSIVVTTDQPLAAVSALASGQTNASSTYFGFGAPGVPQSVRLLDSTGGSILFQPTTSASGLSFFTVQNVSSTAPSITVRFTDGTLTNQVPNDDPGPGIKGASAGSGDRR